MFHIKVVRKLMVQPVQNFTCVYCDDSSRVVIKHKFLLSANLNFHFQFFQLSYSAMLLTNKHHTQNSLSPQLYWPLDLYQIVYDDWHIMDCTFQLLRDICMSPLNTTFIESALWHYYNSIRKVSSLHYLFDNIGRIIKNNPSA